MIIRRFRVSYPDLNTKLIMHVALLDDFILRYSNDVDYLEIADIMVYISIL